MVCRYSVDLQLHSYAGSLQLERNTVRLANTASTASTVIILPSKSSNTQARLRYFDISSLLLTL